MKSIIYARVSSKDQEETGYSLPAQKKLLSSYAGEKELRVVKTYSISESASGKKQREVFTEMLEHARKNNIKNIICEKVDRLTRNFKDAVDINEWINEDAERRVHFVKENVVLDKESKSNEKFIWNIKVAVAQYYIDNLSEEVKKGQAEKLAQGHLPSPAKLGYETVGDQGHKIHVIKNPEGNLIAKMFDLYASGQYSTKKLAQSMYELGLRSKSGRQLHKSDIHRLLCDPYYYGMIPWKGRLYPGKHEPVISKQMFDTVQTYLRRKGGPKYRKHNQLFKGMLCCAGCGGTITWEIQKGHWYGHCNGYRQCDQKTYVRQEAVEEQLIGFINECKALSPRLIEWAKKALKEAHTQKIANHNEVVGDLKRRHSAVQKKIDRLFDLLVDGKIPQNVCERMEREYQREKEALRDAIAKHDYADERYFELSSTLLDLAKNAGEIYRKAESVESKRQLLSLVFSNLVLDKEKVVYEPRKPFALLAEAAKSQNGSEGRSKFEPSWRCIRGRFIGQRA